MTSFCLELEVGFVPWWCSARFFLQLSSVPVCSQGMLPSGLPSANEMHVLLDSGQMTDLAIAAYSIFLPLKCLGLIWSMFLFMVHLQCNAFSKIWEDLHTLFRVFSCWFLLNVVACFRWVVPPILYNLFFFNFGTSWSLSHQFIGFFFPEHCSRCLVCWHYYTYTHLPIVMNTVIAHFCDLSSVLCDPELTSVWLVFGFT